MNSLKAGLVCLIVAFFIFACSQNQTGSVRNVTHADNGLAVANSDAKSNAVPDELAEARKNYAEFCVKCHKEDGIGGISEIDGKRIKAPNFTSERMKKDEDADWIDTIKNGIADDGMPAYKDRLNERQIKDLVKMIRRDFQKK